ncbi:EAL domain-containing protein [Xanthobacter sp. KR7-65]|uniref:putative bifunctional diguanylate cyclase/phosphodiesterase n=1 Tax=Xanthobacter sp. KR7-65 TaxID=3156612 RepID=UPI0032B3D217
MPTLTPYGEKSPPLPHLAVEARGKAKAAPWSTLEKELLIYCVVLVAVVVLATVALLTSLQRSMIDDRLKGLSNLTTSISAEAQRLLQAIEYVEEGLAQRLADANVGSQQRLEEYFATRDAHLMLRGTIAGLPFIDGLSVADAAGNIVGTTRSWPSQKVNVADRPYFQTVTRSNAPETFISMPLTSRLTGRPSILIARRLTAPDGSLLGVIIATIELNELESALARIDLGPAGLIALVRDDGARLAGSPARAPLDQTRPTESLARGAAALARVPPAGGIIPVGTLDEHERFAAVAKMPSWSSTLVVSETRKSVVSNIWQTLFPVVLAALLICLLTLLGTAFVIRQLRNQGRLAALEHVQARRDVLTGLPNRLQFAEDIQILGADGSTAPFALLLIDLDYFKVVNDSLGHDVGDGVLQSLARRMSGVLGPRDTVARLGGDEFAIVRQGVVGNEDALELARALTEAVREPFHIEHRQVVIGCTVGIALCPRDGDNVLSLLKSADLALYHAKRLGHGSISVFSPSLGEAARARHNLQIRLDEAWRERQFTLAYQPIFETKSRRLSGFEVLLRWTHPELGPVRPDIFVPIAEETGLIIPIGAWVLEEACRAAAQWPCDLTVSVNLSPVQFRGGAVMAQVLNALKRTGLPSQRLELEITESALLQDGPAVRAALEQFHDAGIAVALDDFGTGYSSLSHLKYLHINRIKVDRSFVSNVADDPRDRAIIESMFGLARSLTLKSTAEGIESEAQVEIVRRQGCTHLQGYLLGRPCSAEDALKLALAPVS